MVAKIGGAPSPATFDKLSKDLDQAADQLRPTTKPDARRSDGFSPVTTAGNEALDATAKLIEGLADTAGQAAQLTATGGLASAGVTGWVSETVPEGASFASKGVAHGFAKIHDAFAALLSKVKTATVHEVQSDAYAVSFSERMFGKPSQQLNRSAGEMNAAWQSYAESVRLLGAKAAPHVAGLSGNLAKAAALTTSPQATKIAEFGVRLSTIAVQAAEHGAPGAGEVALLGARLAATSANVLSNPDQAQVKDVVQGQLAACRNELAQLVASNPGLQQYARALLSK